MPDVILAMLRIIFLGLVYLFVWQVARAIGSHLGVSLRRDRKEGRRVVIVKSESQQGRELEIKDVSVLGRSPDADVLLAHAVHDHRVVGMGSTQSVSIAGVVIVAIRTTIDQQWLTVDPQY